MPRDKSPLMSEPNAAGMGGGDSPRLVIDGAGAMNQCIERLFLACRRCLLVRARRLDFDFYFSDAFGECCQSIITGDLHNEILFLIEDDKYLMHANARLVALARRFSSYIKVKVVPEECIERDEMFIVQDSSGYLHQPNVDFARGVLDTADRGAASRLERRFRGLWERSAEPPELFVAGL